MINIPLTTPLGIPVTTIGIWMSGGADSSMLCYLLAKKIKDENLPIKIKPFTVQKQHGVFGFLRVTEKIKELLNADSIFEEQVVYHAPIEGWVHADYQAVYAVKNQENIKDNKFQILYSGITTNPPKEIQESFKWGILPDCEDIRAEGKVKLKEKYFTKEHESKTYEFYEIKPFFDINKKAVSELYREHDVLEELFPLTRSCEAHELSEGH
jgi:hypothetical protein